MISAQKYVFSLAILGIFSACQTQNEATISVEKIRTDVAFLADDRMEGRETGTSGELMAAQYISERFENMGIPALYDNYQQTFTHKEKSHPHDTSGQVIEGRNVVAYIDKKAEKNIIIGAHYDHLGWGEQNSLHADSIKAIHNGADDNASGVAALLAMTEQLKAMPLNHNVVLIAFSGEEKGLWGSNHFANTDTNIIANSDFMVNMDMVGRLDSANRLAIYGVGTSPVLIPTIEKLNKDFSLKFDSSGVGPSDHTSFYLEDMPVLHFFTGQHEDYHKPSDDADKINYEGIKSVSEYILAIIKDLDNKDSIPFTKTKDKNQKGRKFSVTLGVIPDYLFDGTGMKIDGVKEERPAQRAGILKDDIVIKMGDLDINSMMDYMKSLSVFKSKETIDVIVLRKDEKVKIEVTFD